MDLNGYFFFRRIKGCCLVNGVEQLVEYYYKYFYKQYQSIFINSIILYLFMLCGLRGNRKVCSLVNDVIRFMEKFYLFWS